MPQAERRHGRPSLNRRLLRRLLAPLLVLFCIDGAASYAYSLHYANSVYDSWLYDSVSSLALVVDFRNQRAVLDLAPSTVRLFEWDVADTTYYAVYGSRSGLIGGRGDLPMPSGSASRYKEAQLYNGRIDGNPVRIAVLKLPPSAGNEAVTVQVAETRTKRSALARQMLAGVLIPQLLLIFVAGATVRSGVRWGLAPLSMLAGRLEKQDPLRLRPIPDDDVPAEVRPLVDSLNTLLTRLDQAATAQRRFVADAAHQLRTPITSLKLNVEQALREETSEDLLPLLQECARAANRVAHLSQQLLMLARTEPEAGATIPFESLNLAELAADVGAEWVAAADRKRIDLSLTAPDAPVLVRGNRVLLREAVANLIDNAIRYHPGDGQIAIRVEAEPQPSVAVIDDGPGIPIAQRREALKRFSRLNPNHPDGSGLGLSIVQEIVRLHGGDIHFGEGLGERGISVGFHLGE